jgi:hypothetical protein
MHADILGEMMLPFTQTQDLNLLYMLAKFFNPTMKEPQIRVTLINNLGHNKESHGR